MKYRTQFVTGNTSFYYTGFRSGCFSNDLRGFSQCSEDLINSGRLRWARHVARMEESTGAYKVSVGKPEGRSLLERPRRRCVDNIKMDLREVKWKCMDWIDLP
jgi:hypothetical protein